MERTCDALRYMKFCLHGDHGTKSTELLQDIVTMEQGLAQKTVLRREENGFYMTGKGEPGSPRARYCHSSCRQPSKFERAVKDQKEGLHTSEEDLKMAMAAVAIPAMLQTAARPGSIKKNMTLDEFEEASLVEGVYVPGGLPISKMSNLIN